METTITGKYKKYICGLLSNYGMRLSAGLSLFLLMTTINLVFGQSRTEKTEKYRKYEKKLIYVRGYIISAEGDKIKGLIKMKSGDATEFRNIKFIHYDGTKATYHPSDIKGFGHHSNSYKSVNNDFYEVISNGEKIDLLRKVSLQLESGIAYGIVGAGSGNVTHTPYFSENDTFHLLINKTGELVEMRKKDFKSKVSELFKSCSSLIESINNDELGFENLRTVVHRYNYCR